MLQCNLATLSYTAILKYCSYKLESYEPQPFIPFFFCSCSPSPSSLSLSQSEESRLPAIPSMNQSHMLTTDHSNSVQDSVDKLLSGFDKENEAIRKSKALSEFDRERRERRDGMRLLTNVDTNQVSRLPDIHTQYSKVVRSCVNLIAN